MDPWTIFWTIFRPYFGLFFGPFFGPIFGPFFLDHFSRTIFPEEGRPLALREGRDAIYQYSGRCGKQIVVTEGGERQIKLSIRKEGWEFVLLVNATD